MSEIWPFDAKRRLAESAVNPIRPFKCLLLMPFEDRFNHIAEIIEQTVRQTVEQFSAQFHMELPQINRLDWVTSTKVIQQELWQEVEEADLVFCDITGYNPNVMFELGVCAGWKNISQVVLLKDHFFKQPSAFDIAPIRYTEYQLTTEGVKDLTEKVMRHTLNVLIAFPDFQGESPNITTPFSIDFKNNQDDLRIYTPPFAHRRVVDESLEFGSRTHFPNSWASIEKKPFLNFTFEFDARFSNPVQGNGYIGVGLRSQHYYANLGAHILYLNHDGKIILTEPSEEPPDFYYHHDLRGPTSIDLFAYHRFRIAFNESFLEVQVDDRQQRFAVAKMKKVMGPGLIRFQAHMSWMAIKQLHLDSVVTG